MVLLTVHGIGGDLSAPIGRLEILRGGGGGGKDRMDIT